ncbi:Uncharacterized conserved protein [uncultured Clostridium sp.]|uniref:YkvA family protein n=1 Tax=uncultured Clostridium sp. TaxID=59620 RepID=UPI0008208EE0|nr:DUF1232 domain-containing protein [uncultured Clostridium sp.]SCK02055.1 Uncharacterized conserved protein [uncultured Clostridium sp.]
MEEKEFSQDELDESLNKEEYSKEYSEESLLKKIKKNFSKAGVSVVYGALLLFYSLKDPSVPMKAKATIIGALGYFIAPIDLIADPIPVAGYGDDLAAIITALGVISIYLTEETKQKARNKTKELFGNAKDSDFDVVDSKI